MTCFEDSGLDFICEVCDEQLQLDNPNALPDHLFSKDHWKNVTDKVQFRVAKTEEACRHHLSYSMCVPDRSDVTFNVNLYTATATMEGEVAKSVGELSNAQAQQRRKYGGRVGSRAPTVS